MKLLLAVLDFHTADLEIREKFSLTANKAADLAKNIQETYHLSACLLLCTCNRTEIYMRALSAVNAQHILCEVLHLPAEPYVNHFVCQEDDAVIDHLMNVACGMESLVLGEDQIISQVKTALSMAQERQSIDSVLQKIFHVSIAAAKRIKTNVRLSAVATSVAYRAIELLKAEISLVNKKVLVIGNGEIGKLLSNLLVSEGANTTVTVREYKTGVVSIPAGCESIPYRSRYDYLPMCDICFSATSSPHHTILKEKVEQSVYPNYFVDLAVPRDIEPTVSKLGIRLINVDDLGSGKASETDLVRIKAIQEQHKERFYKWYDYRTRLGRDIV